jgi:DNA-directed RNA polymerase subunit beta
MPVTILSGAIACPVDFAELFVHYLSPPHGQRGAQMDCRIRMRGEVAFDITDVIGAKVVVAKDKRITVRHTELETSNQQHQRSRRFGRVVAKEHCRRHGRSTTPANTAEKHR